MKKLLIATGLLVMFGFAAQAQKPTKKERIQYLFTLMGQDSMMSKMAVTMSGYYAKTMKRLDDENGSSTYDSTKTAGTMKTAMEMMRETLKNAMVDSYDKHFTSAEIEDFIRFYASKSGQKLVQETPAMTNEMFMMMATKRPAFIKKEMEQQQ